MAQILILSYSFTLIINFYKNNKPFKIVFYFLQTSALENLSFLSKILSQKSD